MVHILLVNALIMSKFAQNMLSKLLKFWLTLKCGSKTAKIKINWLTHIIGHVIPDKPNYFQEASLSI